MTTRKKPPRPSRPAKPTRIHTATLIRQIWPGMFVTVAGAGSLAALAGLPFIEPYGAWLTWLLGRLAPTGALLLLGGGLWLLLWPLLPQAWQPRAGFFLGIELLFIAALIAIQAGAGWTRPSFHGERAGSSGWLLASTLYVAVGAWNGSAVLLAIFVGGCYLCWHDAPVQIRRR